jgi:hypothetical protein
VFFFYPLDFTFVWWVHRRPLVTAQTSRWAQPRRPPQLAAAAYAWRPRAPAPTLALALRLILVLVLSPRSPTEIVAFTDRIKEFKDINCEVGGGWVGGGGVGVGGGGFLVREATKWG